MTKGEWTAELRRRIRRLPDDEIKRVIDYYEELYADKSERGFPENEIISQFGNPADVADKILIDYDGDASSVQAPFEGRKKAKDEKKEEHVAPPKKQSEDAPEKPADKTEPCKEKPETPKRKTKRTLRNDRLLLFVLINVLFGFVFFILLGVVYIVSFALLVAFGACAGGSAVGFVLSVITIFTASPTTGFVQVGMCLALGGVCLLLSPLLEMGIKALIKGSKTLFCALRDWMTKEEEAQA